MVPAQSLIADDNCTFESIYGLLRAQARWYLRREQNAHSLSPTLLVHEAWIALARSQTVNITDGVHYVRLVSRVMKNLLVDRARRKGTLARGGSCRPLKWSDATEPSQSDCELILAVADCLDRLAERSPRLATLVELRYFGGFTENEAAQILGLSTRSVRRQWKAARIRLLELLQTPTRCGGQANG